MNLLPIVFLFLLLISFSSHAIWNQYAFCAKTKKTILMIENSQQQRQTGAAVESFRNEMVKSNQLNQRVLLETVTNKQVNYIEG